MGIHNESTNAKCTVFEAEMRRRLWWSLVIFDNRVCEMSDHTATMLAPTWDCRTPLNVNDFDIRLEMKKPPVNHGKPTEALFAVVRSELGEYVRHSAFHLDFTNPSLKTIAKDTQFQSIMEGDELIALEKAMEDKYLEFCNLENPLHFMTIWTMRGYLAKTRLVEHYSRYSSSSSIQQTDAQRNAAVAHALSMLECDTKLMTSPLTKGYLWLVHFYFPFPAYIHIVQDLKRRPLNIHAEKNWEVMSDNYEARIMKMEPEYGPFFRVLAKILLQAWETREASFRHLDKPLEPLRMVLDIRYRLMQMTADAQRSNIEQNSAGSMNIDHLPMPMDFGGHGLSYDMEGQGSTNLGPGRYPDVSGLATTETDVNQVDWTTTDWNLMHARGWWGWGSHVN